MISTAGEAPLTADKPADGGKGHIVTDEGQGRRRRSRGRRRGRGDAHRDEPGREEGLSEADLSDEITTEADIPGVTGEVPHIAEPEKSGKSTRRERSHVAPGEPGSPMDFWRSGRTRSARERRPTASGARSGPKGLWARITNMYLPPWVPVVAIIFVVFGILAALFIARSATGAPRIGQDHWHVPYTYWVCGEKQAPAPTWEAGVHTHGDGIIHIHPFVHSEEGAGARLVKWFEYGGGKLDSDEVRLPGSDHTYKNGDVCPEGFPEAGATGEVQVFNNGEKVNDYTHFIPHDGDVVRIVFGPPDEQIQLNDRTIIDEARATRTVEMTIDQPGDESTTVFSPSQISVDAGEAVKIVITNKDEVSHGLRVLGGDGEANTPDDFVVVPEGEDPNDTSFSGILEPGQVGFVVVEFDDVLQPVTFQDPTTTATGTITINDVQITPTPAPEEAFDDEVDITMSDGAYDPDGITVKAGDRVKLNLTNNDDFAHGLRIDGPDGVFFTDDDVIADDVLPGETGTFFIQLDAGTYKFQDDFNPDTMTGTLTVE